MAGCGYVCALCEGSGVDEQGNPCEYCSGSFVPTTVEGEEIST